MLLSQTGCGWRDRQLHQAAQLLIAAGAGCTEGGPGPGAGWGMSAEGCCLSSVEDAAQMLNTELGWAGAWATGMRPQPLPSLVYGKTVGEQ